MIDFIKRNRDNIIRGLFLIPIILVGLISISHVVAWFGLTNPVSWAIYLSVAVEVAAMVSLAAASVKIKGGVWFVFIIVTLIQFIGNIFYSYKQIDEKDKDYKAWVELTTPIYESVGLDVENSNTHKRTLAILTGGMLPLISLASLHFFIKYERKKEEDEESIENDDNAVDEPRNDDNDQIVDVTENNGLNNVGEEDGNSVTETLNVDESNDNVNEFKDVLAHNSDENNVLNTSVINPKPHRVRTQNITEEDANLILSKKDRGFSVDVVEPNRNRPTIGTISRRK